MQRSTRFAMSALVVGAVAVVPSPARAANEALLIANAKYEHAKPLRNPPRDIKAMAKVLKDTFGFRVMVKEDLDLAGTYKALGQFRARASKADVALVFYSGHGMEWGGVNYLIPVDARLDNPGAEQFEGVSLQKAIDAITGAKRLKVVILDACRTGAPGRERAELSRGFAAVEADQAGLAIAFSTAPGKPAYDGTGRLSPYTRALTEKLAAKPTLDVRIMFTGLASRTKKYARGPQVPYARFGNMSYDYISLAGRTSRASATDPTDMVKIPAGRFQMGCVPGDGRCDKDEKPRHEVYLDAYFIDRTEVTVAAYKECKSCRAPATGEACNWGRRGRDQHPVNCVSWHDAKAYCESVGKRLPTEAEWERAARRRPNDRYPWGDSAPSDDLAVFGRDWDHGTAKVCSKGEAAFGLCDMAGNVWEWVADCYDKDVYKRSDKVTTNPLIKCSSGGRVLRGGAFVNPAWVLRASNRRRNEPEAPGLGLYGFRCASPAS